MYKHKWYCILIMGLALLVSSVVACAKSEAPPHAPDFTLQSINGETVKLSDLRGKSVMLIFWKILCPSCESQLSHIQSFYNEWSSEKMVALTVNVGENPMLVYDFAKSRELTFPILLDTQGRAAQAYGIPGVPVTFFIDADGLVKAYKIGPFQSQKEMEAALKIAFPSLKLTPKVKVSPEIGYTAPDFTLKTTNGRSISLSDFRGRPVLLNFWVSSCPACIDELPYLQAISNKQANEGLVVLAINCGENSLTVHSIVDRLGITFPILLDTDGKVCADYKRGCPTAFLVDGKGIIKAIKDEAFQKPDEIEDMLKLL